MKNIYIVAAKRTAIGTFGGFFKDIHPADFGATVVKSCIDQAGIKPENIDELISGTVLQAGLGMNIARQVSIKAELPISIPSFTVNKVCGSGMKSIILACQSIIAGDNEVVVAGGTENMDMAPYILKNARYGYRLGNSEVIDHMVYDGLTDVFNNYHMGITAENLVEKYKITREEQDKFAFESQEKALKAIETGKFKEEIVPYKLIDKKGVETIFEIDEHPRRTSLEKLASLKPVFKKDGTITAGNSSGINDGASYLIIASEEACKKYNLKPLVRIANYSTAAIEPEIMGVAPAFAIRKLLQKSKLNVLDIDLWELNEAFAAQSISIFRELPDIPIEKVNVNGGAIALGHPIGASGARITTTLIYEMKKRNSRYGIASLCIGGGQATAILIENI
ncbi:MAG: acetyl-CoA C-acetyltransferase [Spirochaetes bacterium]|nr:acetyl-CoA C-acetyltransferase [Spirochaetota bacterium]